MLLEKYFQPVSSRATDHFRTLLESKVKHAVTHAKFDENSFGDVCEFRQVSQNWNVQCQNKMYSFSKHGLNLFKHK